MKSHAYKGIGLGFALLALSFALEGAPPPQEMTVGAEVEITTPALLETRGKKKERFDGREAEIADRFAELVRAKCVTMGCHVREKSVRWGHGYRVTFPDGFWFQISYDPWCVELQTKPATISDWRRLKPRLDEIIFKTASDNGFLTGQPWYAGHFNFGVKSAFGEDPEKFLRFFVDYTNHPELALGILGNDWSNAPPLSMLEASQRETLSAIVREFRQGKLRTIREVAYAIHHRVYTHTYRKDWDTPFYFQAIGLKWLVWPEYGQEDVPLEVRAVRAQRGTDDFILVSELFQLRIKYLNQQTTPLINLGLKLLGTEVTDQDLVNRFYLYITEAGGDYEHFTPLLEARLRPLVVDPFLTGEMNWLDPAMIERLRVYLPHLAASPWLRDKYWNALRHWGARVGTAGLEVMRGLALRALQAPDTVERGVWEELLRSVLRTPNWKDIAELPLIRRALVRGASMGDRVQRMSGPLEPMRLTLDEGRLPELLLQVIKGRLGGCADAVVRRSQPEPPHLAPEPSALPSDVL